MAQARTKTWKSNITYGLLAALLPLAIVFLLWKATPSDLNFPIAYEDSDVMGAYMQAVSIRDNGWILTSDRQGAPFGVNRTAFPVSMTHNVDSLLLAILVFLTGQNIVLSVNLWYLLLFPLIGVISYFVLREFKIRPVFALCGSTTFATLSYIFLRGIMHIELSAYQFVPLSVLLCAWLWEDERLFVWQRGFFSYRKNIIALIFCFLIGMNGLTYYPFFTCFLLAVTGLMCLLRKKKLCAVQPAIIGITGISLTVGSSLLPLVFSSNNGFAIGAAGGRSPFEAEVYGLKFINLFLPQNGHGIPSLERLISNYQERALLVNENTHVYLGIMGALGFVCLMLALFKEGSQNPKLYLFSRLSLAAFLLGTIGGIGSFVSVFITSALRCYNRISVFIAFLCIAGICLLLSQIKCSPSRQRLLTIGFVLLFSFGIWEQYPGNTPDFAQNQSAYEQDRNFVSQIEDSLQPQAMVFQMPYVPYPEASYLPMTSYLHSNTLRWSYGSIRGSYADCWNSAVERADTDDMVAFLQQVGFSGIWVDRRLYMEQEQLAVLEERLTALCGEPTIREDGQIAFYHLENGEVDVETVNKITSVPILAGGEGMLGWEEEAVWLSKTGEFNIFNPSEQPVGYNLSFELAAPATPEGCPLSIQLNGEVQKQTEIDADYQKITLTLTLQPGVNKLLFVSEANKVAAPGDMRELYVRLKGMQEQNWNVMKQAGCNQCR
ncbi:YfhO family protein [Pygmaiobacter massiliensis]|uniref:YfhO family protein n=1 Tax=Pygmaiobacter massiliensis TaxID=1917873 RepID=UPI0011AF9EE5|nr:YfhO family protein [Pygmaiobacter massiliensis]